MISLLPPADKKILAAARTNTILLRYVVALIVLILFVCMEIAFVYTMLSAEKNTSSATIAENEKKSTEFSDVKQRAAEFSSNLAVAEAIISKQVPYASIFKEFSNTMPPGVIADRISIDPTSIGQPVTLNLRGKSYINILAFKDAFNNSMYFGEAKILTITETANEEGASSYPSHPTTATIEVVFKKELLGLENAA